MDSTHLTVFVKSGYANMTIIITYCNANRQSSMVFIAHGAISVITRRPEEESPLHSYL